MWKRKSVRNAEEKMDQKTNMHARNKREKCAQVYSASDKKKDNARCMNNMRYEFRVKRLLLRCCCYESNLNIHK